MKTLIFAFLILASNLAVAADCRIATVTIEKNGIASTETATTCKEGGEITQGPVKVGDVILEAEVPMSKVTKYFNYQNARCRMYQETFPINKKVKIYHGVICETNANGVNWIVVDRW